MNSDIVTLISKDGKEKIVCYKYMEECFRKEGYVLLSKNIHINLLYKLFDFKILRKIRSFFTLCLRCKFFFKDPKYSEFVIFDRENARSLQEILSNKNYIVISTRIEHINTIYISKKIIFYIIKNFFKRSLKQNYLTALIKSIAPKIILTHISDSEDFHIISEILHNEIKFIAIQTYSPGYFDHMFSEKGKKNFFIPNFFCYAEYDKLFYRKKKVNIGAFEAVGSLKSSLCNEYVKSEKLEINPNKYDICLISEAHNTLNGDLPHVKNMADSVGLVAEFTYKLCKKHNLNIVFSGRGLENIKEASREIYFYKHYLKNYDFKISKSSDKERECPPHINSYLNIMQSKLTIAIFSTMLREAISFEKKFLAFNIVGHPDIKFPGPDIEFPQESICLLTKPSYELFEERVLKILSMTNKEYFDQLGRDKSFIMTPTIDTANIIRKKLKDTLEQNINSNKKYF